MNPCDEHKSSKINGDWCPVCTIHELEILREKVITLEKFLADHADYDQMREKEQEWFIENIHKKYYPENY